MCGANAASDAQLHSHMLQHHTLLCHASAVGDGQAVVVGQHSASKGMEREVHRDSIVYVFVVVRSSCKQLPALVSSVVSN